MAAFSSEREGVLLLDDAGRVVDANDDAAVLLGVSGEELKGRPLADHLVVPQDVASTLFSHRNPTPPLDVRWSSVVMRRQTGDEFSAEITLARTPGLAPGQRIAILRDCTYERRELDSFQRLAAIIDSSNDAVIGKTLDGTVTSWSKGAEKMFGYTAREAIGKSITMLFPRGLVKEEMRILQKIARGEPVDHYETVRVRKDGSLIDVSVSISPIRDDAGNTVGATKIARDITKQKRAEKALRAANERFWVTLDNLIEGCQVVDHDYRYLYLNAAAARQGKHALDELLGRRMEEVYPGIESTPMFASLRLCMEERVPARLENAFRFPDGSTGWFDLRLEPIPEGVFILSEDITEEKQMNEELLRHREHLEELVRDRTAQLETANRELEAFSYSVSHDLRAPLRHIDGFADLLVKHAGASLDEEGRRYLEIIADSAKKMGDLIDELLVFSRMARSPMQTMTIDLTHLVQAAIRDLRWEVDTRAVEWTVDPLPTVTGDMAMLRLVFMNLLSNALKYTRTRPTAAIHVGTEASSEETVIYVRDNGVGFDMKYVGKLFGVFQRLHSAAEFEGTGIGLANVRRIIERHGGRTWAKSELGNGATFYFSLPNTRGRSS